LLVHLVGDVHQPIHVGCGFIDHTAAGPVLVTDPKVIVQKNLPHDRGGNSLVLPISGSINLHSYWDSFIPAQPRTNGNGARASINTISTGLGTDEIRKRRLINQLWGSIQRAAAIQRATVTTSGALAAAPSINPKPPEDWAIDWASNSLEQARKAYAGLSIKRELADGRYEVAWPGKAAYDAACQPIVARQLAAASRNLAALLNAIF